MALLGRGFATRFAPNFGRSPQPFSVTMSRGSDSPMAMAPGKRRSSAVRQRAPNGVARRANGATATTPVPAAEHEKLGLTRERLLQMFETMLLARTIDERSWILNRQGKQPFHISCQGHEGSGVGSAFALDPERDVMAPYYRSLAAVLAFGMTPLEVFLHALARADDPNTGGRQMPGALRTRAPAHPDQWQSRRHADSTRDGRRARQQDPRRRRREHRLLRRWRLVQRRLSRRFEFRRHSPAAGYLRVREQPVRHQRADLQADGRAQRRRPRRRLRHGRRVGGRQRSTGGLSLRARRCRARSRRRRTDAHRSQRAAPHAALVGRRRSPLSTRKRARGSAQPRPDRRLRSYLRAHHLLDEAEEDAMRTRLQKIVSDAYDQAESAPEPEPETAFDHVYAGVRMPDFRARLR